jgi:hypothetical protein
MNSNAASTTAARILARLPDEVQLVDHRLAARPDDRDVCRPHPFALGRFRPGDPRGGDPPVAVEHTAYPEGHLRRDLRVDRPVRRQPRRRDTEHRGLDVRCIGDHPAAHHTRRTGDVDEPGRERASSERLGARDRLAAHGQIGEDLGRSHRFLASRAARLAIARGLVRRSRCACTR